MIEAFVDGDAINPSAHFRSLVKILDAEID
jgi:hypothetical protein